MPLSVGLYNSFFKFFGNREQGRIKISYGKIINTGTLSDLFFDLSAQLYNLRTDQRGCQLREFHTQ